MVMLPEPEWEIEKSEFLKRIGRSETDFKRMLKLPDLRKIERVIPLRFMKNINALVPLHKEILFCLISQIRTKNGLKIGQKFVYRENYTSIVETLSQIFNRFAIHDSISDLGAYFAFGEDKRGIPSLACYIPPILEHHGSDVVIMDGIHRNFVAKQFGPISAVEIRNVGVPFPCGVKSWSEIQVISLADKPKSINDRYFDLNENLFRDLKYLGIDG